MQQGKGSLHYALYGNTVRMLNAAASALISQERGREELFCLSFNINNMQCLACLSLAKI